MMLQSEISVKYITENHDLENAESHRMRYKTQQLDLLSDQLNESTH